MSLFRRKPRREQPDAITLARIAALEQEVAGLQGEVRALKGKAQRGANQTAPELAELRARKREAMMRGSPGLALWPD